MLSTEEKEVLTSILLADDGVEEAFSKLDQYMNNWPKAKKDEACYYLENQVPMTPANA